MKDLDFQCAYTLDQRYQPILRLYITHSGKSESPWNHNKPRPDSLQIISPSRIISHKSLWSEDLKNLSTLKICSFRIVLNHIKTMRISWEVVCMLNYFSYTLRYRRVTIILFLVVRKWESFASSVYFIVPILNVHPRKSLPCSTRNFPRWNVS